MMFSVVVGCTGKAPGREALGLGLGGVGYFRGPGAFMVSSARFSCSSFSFSERIRPLNSAIACSVFWKGLVLLLVLLSLFMSVLCSDNLNKVKQKNHTGPK